MLRTISGSDVIVDYRGDLVPTKAVLHANQAFQDSSGVAVAKGSPDRPTWGREFACTLSGTAFHIATGTAYSTTDSIDLPNVTYKLCFYDANDELLYTYPHPLRLSHLVSPTTWDTVITTSLIPAVPTDPDWEAAVLALIGSNINAWGTLTGDIAVQADLEAALSAKAPLASPALTGNPTVPTQTPGNNTTLVASTAFVQDALGVKAPLASPALTGNPTAPTQASGNNSTRVASTAFVQDAVSSLSTAYTTSIPFDRERYLVAQTMVADIAFTPNETGAVAGAITVVELVADGTHGVSFSGGINVASGSGAFNTTNAVTNFLIFFCLRPGVYFVNIFQAKSADVVSPSLSSATVENANPNKIVLTYSETLDATSVPATGDFSVSGGKTVSGVAISGAVVTLTVNSDYASSDVITGTYTPGTNKIKDLAGNLAPSFTSQSVTNNITATPSNIVPTATVAATWDGTTLTATSAAEWGHHAQCLQKLPAGVDGYAEAVLGTGSLAFGFMEADTVGNYSVIDFGAFNFAGVYSYLPGPVGTAVTATAGDKIRVRRATGILSVYRVTAGVETLIHTYIGTYGSDLFINFALDANGDTCTLPKGLNVVDK